MTPELWVTLVIGVATPLGGVVVAWINRKRHTDQSSTDHPASDSD